MPTLTVFTPTYNRAHTLPRTFDSLQNQDCKDFIWLIVDDGSSDSTAELVKGWQKIEKSFEIRYIFKENGGMHTAHNIAYEAIDTELNVCIDSDDKLAPNAISIILNKWNQIKEYGYAGIIALDADFNNSIIGKGFPSGMKETTVSGYYASGGDGDKKLIYRTDIIKKYPPYPVFKEEKYIALAYKYRMIDQHYKMAVLDEIVCNVEYQKDGSSNTMWRQYLENPKGWMCWRKLCLCYPISTRRKIMDCIHYCSSSIIAKDTRFVSDSPNKLLTIACVPAGWCLAMVIKRRGKQQRSL